MSMASSAPKTSPADEQENLDAHGIQICTERTLPPEIHAFVTALRPHIASSPGTQHSPNTRKVAEQQNRAVYRTEQDSIVLLRNSLLFPDHESMLAINANSNLNRSYLPSDADVVKLWGPLKTAQPDHLFGYKHFRDSKGLPAFSRPQECGLKFDRITDSLHFPFMSAQWKSAKGSEGHFHACLQGTSSPPIHLVQHCHLIHVF
jgi:hypothetical protein